MRGCLKVLIVSAAPDQLNVNYVLRSYVVNGFRIAAPEIKTIGIGYDSEIHYSANEFAPDLLIIFGSVMFDHADYVPLVTTVRKHGGVVAFWLHDDPYEFDASFTKSPILPT